MYLTDGGKNDYRWSRGAERSNLVCARGSRPYPLPLALPLPTNRSNIVCRLARRCEGSPCTSAPLPRALPLPPPLALPSPKWKAVEPCLCGGGPPFPSPPRAPLSPNYYSLSLFFYYYLTSLRGVYLRSARFACASGGGRGGPPVGL